MRLTSPSETVWSRIGLTRTVWRDALLAWLGLHAVLLVLTIWWQFLTNLAYRASSGISWDNLYHPWVVWDGGWYLTIGRDGYTVLPSAAYFPLFPFLEHVLAPLMAGRTDFAGMLIANIAVLLAFVLFRALVEQEFGALVARRALLFLTIFPTAMFFAALYTESLFLLVSVAAFYLIRRRKWLLAGVCIALATLTRSTGILLLLPLSLEAIMHIRRRGIALNAEWGVYLRIVAAIVLPILTLAGWELYLDRHFGVTGAITRAVASGNWQRHLSWPWVGIAQVVRLEFTPVPPGMRAALTRDLFFALLWIGLAVAMAWTWKRGAFPAGYLLYTWASLMLVLVFPVYQGSVSALNSLPRYMLVVFPCFVLIGQWTASSDRAYRVLRALSAAMFVLLMGYFATGQFVA